jgi:MSHA biogenesis protein MshQ
VGGDFNLNLQAPGEGNTGSAGISVDAPGWLEFDWQGAGVSDPTAKATFGIFRRPSSIIYLREAR